MQEPAVALEEVAHHSDFDELPDEQQERPAEESAEESLQESSGGRRVGKDLVEKVRLRREVVGEGAVEERAEPACHHKPRLGRHKLHIVSLRHDQGTTTVDGSFEDGE